MKRTRPRVRWPIPLAWLITSLLVSACGPDRVDDRNDARVSARAANAKAEHGDSLGAASNAVSRTKRIVGNPAAPIDLKYDIPTGVEVGIPFEVDLTFRPRQPAESLTAEVSGMPGLVVIEGQSARFEPVEAGLDYSARVVARADANGTFYLGVIVKAVSKENAAGRAFSIPVAVGSPARISKPSTAKESGEESVESMPARESTDGGETAPNHD